MTKKLALIFALCCTLPSGAATGWAMQAGDAAAAAPTPTPAPAPVAPTLRIGSGDLIEVALFGNPDLSGRYRVDPDGNVALSLIGSLHVAGMTAGEAATAIAKRYVQEQILQPAAAHATVFIAEYATQGITVSGEVKSPGVYPALGVRKLNDLIVAAGGELPTAASTVIVTRKDDPAHPLRLTYNPESLKPVIPDVQIFPGDSILVPRAGIVYVVGDVARSGGFVLNGRNQLTVEEALALAGGSGPSPDWKHVQLVRTLDDGRKEAVTIPLHRILKNRAPDVALQDGDILYVPTNDFRLASIQAIQDMVSLGSGYVLYRSTINSTTSSAPSAAATPSTN